MRAAFPWMGDLEIPLAALVSGMGSEVISTAALDADVLDIGARLAPEGMCIPFKLTLGTMYRNLQAGADTLVYTSGSWSCRYGYYGPLQQLILRDQGFRFRLLELKREELGNLLREMLVLARGSWSRVALRALRAARLAWHKSATLELADLRARQLRPLVREPSLPGRIQDRGRRSINASRSVRAVRATRLWLDREFDRLALVRAEPPLRVRVIGESYCVLEPFVNHHAIRRLGELGVYAEPFETAHEWLGFHALRLDRRAIRRAERESARYWKMCVGGEDQTALGWLLQAPEQGFDGVVHLHPFACMPSTAVQPVLAQASRDRGIPLLSLALDEHTGEAGLTTRLEAFVSMLTMRRRCGSARSSRAKDSQVVVDARRSVGPA